MDILYAHYIRKKKCDCADWKENIDKVNAGFKKHKYKGKPFKFCPWCPKELK